VGLEARTGVAGNLLHFLILYPFFVLWGFEGFVVIGPISVVGVAVSFVWLYSRAEGIPLGEHLQAVLVRPVLVFIPVVACALGIDRWVHFDLPEISARWNVLIELGVAGVLYAAVAGGMLWFVLLSGDERESIVARARRLMGGASPRVEAAVAR
jgi:peptidoglycan biosynthesis protein MviN/MurJ (putative lipid II flippase)